MSEIGDRLYPMIAERALALPESTVKISHGAPAFQVAGKRIFAWFRDNHHGDGVVALCVKTSGAEEQDMLIEANPDLYFRPSYLAHAGWIGLRLDEEDPDWDHIADWIERSWCRIAPRRLVELF